jgi:hypothetical protein
VHDLGCTFVTIAAENWRKSMSPEKLKELKELAEKATADWSGCSVEGEDTGIDYTDTTWFSVGPETTFELATADLDFALAARTAVPELIAEVEKLRLGADLVREMLTDAPMHPKVRDEILKTLK